MINTLLDKAIRAAQSAKLLLDNGDDSGACNRAYYAMFDAASAALRAFEAPIIDEKGRIASNHSGIISSFGLLIVKEGHLPRELGRALNKAEIIRLEADYLAGAIKKEDALWMVEISEKFVDSVKELVLEIQSDTCVVCGAIPCICKKEGQRG